MRCARLAVAFLGLWAAQAQAGLFDDEEARRRISDLSIKTESRFDQQARAQLELSTLIQRQAEEIARLRGLVETLTYELDVARKRQQDFYLDLDTRLRKLEPSVESVSAAPAAEGAAADPAKANAEYDAALAHFKAARYKESAQAFKAFVTTYPDHALAPNAQYWLGNAWYAQRDCTKAIEAQSVVTTRYASSDKAPDAWLAMATCQQELGNAKGARRSLETLVEKYPNAPSATTARERLKKQK